MEKFSCDTSARFTSIGWLYEQMMPVRSEKQEASFHIHLTMFILNSYNTKLNSVGRFSINVAAFLTLVDSNCPHLMVEEQN